MAKKKTKKTRDSWPTTVPVFKQEHILIDPKRYVKGKQRTCFGWLLHLFLKEPDWGMPDRRDLEDSISEFKRNAPGIRKYPSIEHWEDEQTKAKCVTALNKTMKALEYEVREWDANHDRVVRKKKK